MQFCKEYNAATQVRCTGAQLALLGRRGGAGLAAWRRHQAAGGQLQAVNSKQLVQSSPWSSSWRQQDVPGRCSTSDTGGCTSLPPLLLPP